MATVLVKTYEELAQEWVGYLLVLDPTISPEQLSSMALNATALFQTMLDNFTQENELADPAEKTVDRLMLTSDGRVGVMRGSHSVGLKRMVSNA